MVEEPGPGAIDGHVVEADDGTPIANALVGVQGGQSVLTNRNGSFLIRNVPSGAHPLRVTGLGWRQKSADFVTVSSAETTLVTIHLQRAAIPLPEILIEPGRFGFLEKAPTGTARIRTRKEVQTLPQLGEDAFRAMKDLPGVASGDISTRLHIRGGEDREILVRLDGMELYEPYHVMDWEGALGIVDINVLEGMELMSGGSGVQYGGTLTGVLDMNTRQPSGEAKTTLGVSISWSPG